MKIIAAVAMKIIADVALLLIISIGVVAFVTLITELAIDFTMDLKERIENNRRNKR